MSDENGEENFLEHTYLFHPVNSFTLASGSQRKLSEGVITRRRQTDSVECGVSSNAIRISKELRNLYKVSSTLGEFFIDKSEIAIRPQMLHIYL